MGRFKLADNIEAPDSFRKAVHFILTWQPERWVEKGTPGYNAAREARLELKRFFFKKIKPKFRG